MRLVRFLLLVALLVFRFWLDNCTVRTKEYDVFCGIPPGFEGVRIAQISDLHGNERLYGPLLRHTRSARPDLIVLTGDITDAPEQWPELEKLLRSLTEIAPCYYVSGNHEWADLEPEPLFRRIAETGVRVLRNEWVFLERSGDLVALVGFEDPNGTGDGSEPDRAIVFEGEVFLGGKGTGAGFVGIDDQYVLHVGLGSVAELEVCRLVRSHTDDFIIALCHRPQLFPELAEGGCGLVFSGHNHGGVIRIPFYGGLIPPARERGEYDAGLFHRDGSVLLVSPGLAGTNGVPRFLNRPQLCLAVLHQWQAEGGEA